MSENDEDRSSLGGRYLNARLGNPESMELSTLHCLSARGKWEFDLKLHPRYESL